LRLATHPKIGRCSMERRNVCMTVNFKFKDTVGIWTWDKSVIQIALFSLNQAYEIWNI
jgi:hypothetical protein